MLRSLVGSEMCIRDRLELITDMVTDYAVVSPTDYYDATVTDQLLKEWTSAEAYQMTAITYDGTYTLSLIHI